ncbi:MAG: hypothetical protein GY803_10275 [Chloroflexi bacterium]|nr:hypothetical protein [Chloroflexota bacterium]
MLNLFKNRTDQQSTDAMRQAAALLGRLREYQLAFLFEKQREMERAVAQTGGASAAAETDESKDFGGFDEFWDE